MRRAMALVVCLGLVAGVALQGQGAAPPVIRLSKAERARLEQKADELDERLGRLYQLGKVAEGAALAVQVVKLRQALYPEIEYPDGHPELAVSLNRLGFVLEVRGELVKALNYYEKSLAMLEKLYSESRYPDGNASLAKALNNLGSTLRKMGELTKALGYYERALVMFQKLYPDGHPDLAGSLNNLGSALEDVGESAKALDCFAKALTMRQKLYPRSRYPDGHARLAISLHDLGGVLWTMGQLAKALDYFEQAYAMNQRLYPTFRYPDGYPDLATSLDNLGGILQAMRQPAKALDYRKKAHAMTEKLYPKADYPDGHPALAISLNNLGGTYSDMGEPAKARGYFEKALAMQKKLYPPHRFKDGHPNLARTLDNLGDVLASLGERTQALDHTEKAHVMLLKHTEREIGNVSEVQARAFLHSLPRLQSGYLSAAVSLPGKEASSYEAIWPARVLLLRLLFGRHESARVALLKSAEARHTWQELAVVRRQMSWLMIEPDNDPADRDKALEKLNREQIRLEQTMVKLLPELEERKQLAQLGPKDLASMLPTQSAFLDFVRYYHVSNGKFLGWRYLAFVLTPDARVACLQLGDAKPIDTAIASWRRSLNANEPSNAPARLRTLVWDKIESTLPKDTRTLYLCLDGDLTQLPFAALPGRHKDTVLLEDYTLAVVPAGQWLLQQLRKSPAEDKFSKPVAFGDIAFGTGKYDPLPATAREIDRVVAKMGGTTLRSKDATVSALRKHLPEATVAHLATHAYYDKKTLDEEYARIKKHRETWTLNAQGSERVGLALRNPLGFAGLVLAGGNDPTTADGGGILTGLDILELPLGKLHLCVLSACETGLGEWTADAGVAGLQRAFHVAGCRNVVGSLWQVSDDATAALMTQFYHEMRVNKRTPLAALREAQLTIYRHPERIQSLAGKRGAPDLEKAVASGSAPAKLAVGAQGQKADTRLWAAFVLSGPGN